MKKLFKSHQKVEDKDTLSREQGPRAISPFTIINNVNDASSPDAQLQYYAQQQSMHYQQQNAAQQRDRERERDFQQRQQANRNSMAAYPSTDDISSWELVQGHTNPYRHNKQQPASDRERSPSLASLSASNSTLPNPFSPQAPTPPYAQQFSGSRASSLNSLPPGASQPSPHATAAPLLSQSIPLNAAGPPPPGSAGSYVASPTSPGAVSGLSSSGTTVASAGSATALLGGGNEASGRGGTLRKKSPSHSANQNQAVQQVSQHPTQAVSGPQSQASSPPQASTAAILRALDSSMLGGSVPPPQHQHKTGLVSKPSLRSSHREVRDPHHPQPQQHPQSLQQHHIIPHPHLRVPALNSRKEKPQVTRHSQQRQHSHNHRAHSLSDIEFNTNDGAGSDFGEDSMRRSTDADPEHERDSLEIERRRREASWRERDLEIEGKVPRKGSGGTGGKGRDKDRDRDSRGFFERLQIGDGDGKREVGSREKDEKPDKKEKREKEDWKAQLTNIFSTGKDKDKDRTKGKKEYDTTIEPLTLPPQQPPAPPRLDISAPNQPPPLAYANAPPSAITPNEVPYHSAPAANAPVTVLNSNNQSLSHGHGGDPLTRMVGLFVSPSQEGIDWALALELCEHTKGKERKDVKEAEANAKSIAKALRKELKYARPSEQLGAVTLWAVMLQNASDFFITQTSSRKFLDVVEDVILHTRSSVIRDRLLEVLGAAAYLANQKSGKDSSKRENFKIVWRKVKPEMLPNEGMPLSLDNPMFHSQPLFSHPEGDDRLRLRPPMGERRSSRNGIISIDEDIRRLFQECKIGRGNAQLLNEALAFATPEDLKEKEIIKEFYEKCRASQELIQMQISWASAGAERSRVRQLEALGPDGLRNGEELPPTREERLLGELLAANEELAEALRIYGDIERIGFETEAERKVRERSKVEIRATPMDHQLSGEASAFLAAPSIAPSSSRSPSPASFMNSQASHSPYLLPPSDKQTTDSFPVSATALHHHNLAQIQTQAPQFMGSDSSHTHSHNTHSHSQVHLAPLPSRPLHGPRSPPPSGAAAAAAAAASVIARGVGGAHSRTPSPIHVSRPNSVIHSRAASVDTSLGSSIDTNPKLERDLSEQTVHFGVGSPDTDSHHPESFEGRQLSEKAAGKRKVVEGPSESNAGTQNGDAAHHSDDLPLDNLRSEFDTDDNDPDDTYPDRWKPKVHYAYDAAAERARERMRELAVGGLG